MLLNPLLILIKRKVVDIPLINKYIKEGRTIEDGLRMYNDVVGHNSYGRQKLSMKDLKLVWEYLK